MSRDARVVPLGASSVTHPFRSVRRFGIAATAIVVLVAVLAGLVPAAAQDGVDPERPPRPDIVVIYMDDFSPLADWLWCDAERTPTLADFCANGVTFANASVSTPLCCPARGNLLTGQYGHRNGITDNTMDDFDPAFTIGVKLQGQRYRTGYFGKYLNGLRDTVRTRAAMKPFVKGWDRFAVMWENQGKFYDYRLFSKRGTTEYGSKAADHSSNVAMQNAVDFIDAVPARRRLFALISLYDGHGPLTPLKRFEDHPACENVAPWDGPAYDEEDVSDKPAYVRTSPRLKPPVYGLRGRCRSAMTVDHVAGRIVKALRDAGRLDDTLLILTADNGFMYGDHRQRSKFDAYATPVPLFMRWRSEWGDTPRVVEEPVTNLDLAPTLCELAGCRMPRADGTSIVPLMDGSSDRLEREFIYEEMLHAAPTWDRRDRGRPGWYGVRSTLAYSDTRWVYTEYQRGDRPQGDVELYDLTTDPHQLDNLAGRPDVADVERDLRRMLMEEVVRPNKVSFRAKLPPVGGGRR